MRYGWDEGKRRQNLKEHGVDFTAVYEFNWDFAVRRVDDREDYGELREQAIGFIGASLYMLVFTERTDDLGEVIWVISLARPKRRKRGSMSERRRNSTSTGPRSWEEARRIAREDIERTTPEEDAIVHARALRDPDNPPMTDQQLAQFRRVADVRPELIRRYRGQRGLQKSKPVKTRVSLRLDPDVIAFFRKKRCWLAIAHQRRAA